MHIYFSGIGGAGLSPLAMLAQDCGFEVSGSDVVKSLSTQEVEKRGIPITINQSLEEISALHARRPIDWIVYTSALSPDHPHCVFAKTYGIKLSKRHDLINLIIKEKNLKLIAVAGTHGKTTTTAMLTWMFKQLHIPVSYSIGSNITFGPAAKYEERSKYFVYEADEFDKNFLNFTPEISVITSLDYDHRDTYPHQEDYKKAFYTFIKQTQGLVCAWKEDVQDIISTEHDFTARLYLPKKSDEMNQTYLSKITLPGKHNRENGFLAISAISTITTTDSLELSQVLSTFPGTQRRMEKLSPNFYSDYAHHPMEIKATLQLARELIQTTSPTSKLIAVYQPHQNIRQHEPQVQEGYKTCFDAADKIYWLPTYLSREDKELEIIPAEKLASLVESKAQVELADLTPELHQKIAAHLYHGDVVVLMGAGSIDAWGRSLVVNTEDYA
jgi:UDP-N-acetylmuramate--alanine ligase